MPETISRHTGSYSDPWVVKVRKKRPQTDLWIDDDLSDVTAVKVSMYDSDGDAVFEDRDGSVYDLANALISYQPVAGDVATVGFFTVIYTLTRGGTPQVLPSEESNELYVRIWE